MLPMLLLTTNSLEIKEYGMGNRYYCFCALLGVFLLSLLNLDNGEIILGYFLISLTGIDILYREIPNDATEFLIFVAIFSLPKITSFDILVYFIFIVVFYILHLKGGLGGGDFKLYCSMLIITPGFKFLIIMILCSVFGCLYFMCSKGNSKVLPMVPLILISFICVEILF